jgi:hypothetical protein
MPGGTIERDQRIAVVAGVPAVITSRLLRSRECGCCFAGRAGALAAAVALMPVGGCDRALRWRSLRPATIGLAKAIMVPRTGGGTKAIALTATTHALRDGPAVSARLRISRPPVARPCPSQRLQERRESRRHGDPPVRSVAAQSARTRGLVGTLGAAFGRGSLRPSTATNSRHRHKT